MHKTANVLNKLPKSQQPKAKRALQEIWMAETKVDAEAAFDAFVEAYELKYEKAAECLAEGSRRAARVLRLPCRALEASADDEPDREHLRHRAAPHDPIEGLPLEQDRAWPWSSSWSRVRRKAGAVSTVTPSCQNSSWV